MKNMDIKNPKGYICGMIYDENNGQIIRDAEVTSANKKLQIEMTLNGIFFARGKPDLYRITASANNYEKVDVQVRITSDLQERNIYLRSVDVSQIA